MSKNIESVVICCFKRDVHLLRICIASVRYWHPTIPVYLLKDEGHGKFSTEEIEKHWNAKVLETEFKKGGWGLTKLMALFAEENSRILLLDSDTVFLGPVLDYLGQFEEDFVVTGVKSDDPSHYLIPRDYIAVDKVKEIFDKEYVYPGYGFNSGHIVMTRGLINKGDFHKLVDFTDSGFKAIAPVGLFPHADQGIFNYIFAKKKQEGLCSVRYDDFWLWSGLEELSEISLERLQQKKGYNKIIHWAGTKSHFISKMDRSDILFFYEDIYYQKLPFGSLRKKIHHFSRIFMLSAKKALKILGLISK